MIKLKIDGMDVSVPKGTSILDAAKSVQVQIPTLCYHPDLKPTGSNPYIVLPSGLKTHRCLRYLYSKSQWSDAAFLLYTG